MFTLYHNLETQDGLRSDGAGIIGAVREALQMWKEEKKVITFEVVLEKDNEIYYTKQGKGPLINENIVLVEADGRVTPRVVRDAAIAVKRFLQRTKETRGLLANVSKVDAVLKNGVRQVPEGMRMVPSMLNLEDQLQAVLDCLYADGEDRK